MFANFSNSTVAPWKLAPFAEEWTHLLEHTCARVVLNSSSSSTELRRRDGLECGLPRPRLLQTAAPSAPLVYSRGKKDTRLAQMLARGSLFPPALPINGLC